MVPIRTRAIVAACIAATAIAMLVSCEREERRFAEVPPTATPSAMITASHLQPGPAVISANVAGPYADNAYGVSEGKRLFAAMNCSGCHANGGGGMGPALMDYNWIYGSDPEQIFASIAEGRPNGMPSWKYRLSNQQIWELVAYVRSLSSLVPKGARAARDDHMQVKTAENQTPKVQPKMTDAPTGAITP